jgi:hypothetical protein
MLRRDLDCAARQQADRIVSGQSKFAQPLQRDQGKNEQGCRHAA